MSRSLLLTHRRRVAALAVVIAANAAAQALIVAVAPPLPLEAGALVLAALSGAVLIASVVACWRIVSPDGAGIRALVGLVVATGVVAAIAAVVVPPAVPVVVALGCAVIAGRGPGGAWRAARRSPARWVLLAVATALAVVLAWVVALLLGLFITGATASAITWPVAGAFAAVVIQGWARLARRVLPMATNVAG